jgi:5-hydroxyisourate hydrolase-like protein (transthyretin family)
LRDRRGLPADLALFGAGFLLSSAAGFALAAGIGGALSSVLAVRNRLALLLGIALVLLVTDAVRARRGHHCSLGLRRQTPRRLGFQPIGPLVWGLDTGLPFTTYRATPLPFIGLACVALGFGHPWIGLAYAAGFLGSLVISCAWPRQNPPQRDLLQVVEALRGFSRPAWTASLVVAFLLALFLSALAARAAPADPAAARISLTGHVQIPPGLAPEEIQIRLLPVLSPYDQGVLTLEGRLLPDAADAAGRARPDARGDFELTARAGMWRVRVSAPGFLDREIDLEPLTEPARLPPLQLERGTPVEIRVSDDAGKPVARAQVAAEPFPEPPRPAAVPRGSWRDAGRVALTDGAGRAVLLRGGGERLQVRAFAAAHQESRSQAAGPGVLHLRLEPAARRLLLEVRTAQGRPAPDALVRSNGWPAGRTDEKGRIQLAIPGAGGGAGSLDLAAQTREGLQTLKRLGAAEARDLDGPLVLTLPAAAEIKGRVLDARTRAPLAGALVWPAEGLFPWVETDAAGAYALPLAAGGPHSWRPSLRAAAPGYFPARVPVAGGPGASATAVLHRSARLRGTVRNRAGEPVPGARIRAHATLFGSDPGGFAVALQNPPGPALAQADGSFVLSGLVPGLRYSLRAEAAGYAGTEAAAVVEESAREKAGFEIVLSAGSSAFGRVVDSAGEPVAGAKLLLRGSSGPAALAFLDGPGAFEPLGSESSSGAGGEFRMKNVAPGTYDLEVRASGFSAKQVSAVEIGATPADLGEIALEPGAVLLGRVVSREGKPVAGATVSARLQGFGDHGGEVAAATATTSADGAFRLEDLRAGEELDLTVTRRGYAEKLVPGVRAPAEQVLEIVIEEAARISGRVLGADRQPLEGAAVAVEPQASAASGSAAGGRTDDAGEFALDSVPPGPLRLRVAAEGWKPKVLEGLEAGPGESIEKLEIVLERGAALAGRVLDARGRPASEAFLEVEGPGAGPMTAARIDISAQADGDGRYRLEGIEPGLRRIEVHWRDRRLTRELEVAPGENVLDLRFEGGTEVSGRVSDGAGNPIAGAQAALVSPAGPPRMAASALTGVDGTFQMTDVPDGSYQLQAEARGYATSAADQAVEVAGAPVTGLEVQLSAGAAVRGRLIGLEPKEAAGAQVSALQETKRLFSAGIVRPDGSYEIQGLMPGDWKISAVAGGSGRTAEATVEIDGATAEEHLDLELKAGLRLTGTVLRAGQPAAGMHVSVRPLKAGSLGVATTNHEGRFELAGLDPGPYKISVAVANGSSQSRPITLADDDDIRIEIDTSRLAGHVIDATTAQPVAGAAISLEPLDRAADDDVPDVPIVGSGEATDSTGFFRIEAVAGGRYRLRAEKDGYASAGLLLTVTAGIDQEGLEVRLTPPRRTASAPASSASP